MHTIKRKQKFFPKRLAGSLVFVITFIGFFGRNHCQPLQDKQKEAPQALVLEHADIFDSSSEKFLTNYTIVIKNAHITDLYKSGEKTLPSDAKVLDLTNKFVIPGLIDAHVHIASDPSEGDSREKVEKRLLMALQGGVSYVRDMAGDGRALADLSRAVKAGDIIAPDIRYAALMAGPDFFIDPRAVVSAKGEIPGQIPWGRAVTLETDLVVAVAEAHGIGASGIKIYAHVEPSLLNRIVQEAHRQGMFVWSHATINPSKPGDAVAAGVDVISHADHLVWEAMPEINVPISAMAMRWMDEDVRQVRPDDPAILSLLEVMGKKGTILDATLHTYKVVVQIAEKQYRNLLPIAKERFNFACAVTRLAYEQGVPVCAGTDDLLDLEYSPLPNVHEEMELLVTECAFTPAEAILAATMISARAAGIDKTHGTISVGKAADLVVLSEDPLGDIRHTRDIVLVIKSGRIVEPPIS